MKVGGAYLVEVTDIDALADARQQPTPPPPRREVRDWAAYAARLHAGLAAGDEMGAREIIEDLVASGISLCVICDHVMVPAMVRVGQQWVDGELGIAEEHRASAICERALGRFGTSPPGRPRGVCVVCTAPGDDHQLPAQMATAVLREDHWQVHHLGSGVPVGEIVALAVAERADLVAISVTWPPTSAEGHALAATLTDTGLRALVGRPGQSLAELVALARDGAA